MIKRLVLCLFLMVSMFTVGMALYQPATATAASSQYCDPKYRPYFLGFPTWYTYLNHGFVNGECQIIFDVKTDIPKVLLAIFEIILRVGAIAAVIFVIRGGFMYVISTGEPERTKAARTTILNAIVGLVIAMLAVAIVNVIARNITS